MKPSDEFAGAHTTDGIVMFDQLQRVLWQNYEGYWECQLTYKIDGYTFGAKGVSRRRIQALSFAMAQVAEQLQDLSEEIRNRELAKLPKPPGLSNV